ncbi:AAA family ATPase [Calothrix sp. PCC 6303]|uniref:AAA family ATPase n=1 Tax=Calothrix sp. PCC 6303 TaxID=1170562 RepID=UPI0002A02366|nr:AAA family ATPase [Calothrix sp. PCC 6303]AFZ02493.1 PAS sensor protein [Calothrix sp. PCC 6303]
MKLPQIKGYTILTQISVSDRAAVYRAVRHGDRRSVIIKVLRSTQPSQNELIQLCNQYTISLHLPIPGIPAPLGLEPFYNSYAFVMEDCGSISLKEYLKTHSLSLTQILNIAIQLAHILHDLAHHRIIHKDIKPANILIHPTTHHVKLIDFGIASRLPKETAQIVTINQLEGTLAYIAPEQTGRMNRGVDYRADFYSLGVTLYELLTHQLPFPSDDPIKLVYCHLAQQPTAISQLCPNLPLVLSDIVSKLMAKNAEDRYQTALGLKYDLELCLSQWQQGEQIDRFAIATQDLSDQFSIPEKLYGREAEVQTLLNTFERVAQGNSELLLVSGFSGVGKTAVINEVHKPITKQQGFFISGKFDQFNRNIPFAAFVQAFRQLMGNLLTSSDAQLQIWKSKILAALGDNAQVMIEVIPELQSIIGIQPPAPELTGDAAQNRFNLLFPKFVRLFAQPEHPLVIFLDDLQWADLTSLKLMQLLIAGESSSSYLLMIGAYRNNEVSPNHPLMLTIEQAIASRTTVSQIEIPALTQTNINRLVADTLLCTTALALPLTELVYRHTNGNPFFTTQLLKRLHQDGAISLDRPANCWLFDPLQVSIDALTDDVLNLMVQQLARLPKSTQELLQLAACIGNKFDLQTLTIVGEQKSDLVAKNLLPALQEGLILPIGETAKLFSSSESMPLDDALTISYKFLHDRVQQAAYSLITEDEKQSIHHSIGLLLFRNTLPEEREARLFEIVNHLNIGSDRIAHPQERKQLAELNLTAGRKAKTATAYESAIAYFTMGIELTPAPGWEQHYPLMLALHQEIVEASYLNANFEQVEQLARPVLQQAKTLLDTIKVRQTQIAVAKAQGQFLAAIQIGLKVLNNLGIEFPSQPTQADIDQAFGQTRLLWNHTAPIGLLDLPLMSDPRLLATMEILTSLSPAAYIAAPVLMPLLMFKQVELSIQFGNCPVSIHSYHDYGLILCGIIGDIDNGYNFGELSLSLLEKFQLPAAKCRSWCVVHYFIKHWKKSLCEILPRLQEASLSGLDSGDLETAHMSTYFYCQYAYFVGQELNKLSQTMDAHLRTMFKVRHTGFISAHQIAQQTTLNLLGQCNPPYILSGQVFNSEISVPQLKSINQRAALFQVYFNQMVLYYLFGKAPEAAESSAQAVEYLDGVVASFSVPIYFWFDALVQLAEYETASLSRQQDILIHVQQLQDKLNYWATMAPTNHQHRCELVVAEQNRVLGNKIDAMEAYDRSILCAKTNGFIQDEALANELAAKFYLEWNKPKIATVYMQEAYNCYQQWGAKAKTDDLEQCYSDSLNLDIRQSLQLDINQVTNIDDIDRLIITSNSNSSTGNPEVDLAAILQASQSLSRTMELQDILQQLTQIILHNSGADYCVLMLPNNDGNWYLEAIAIPEATTVCQVPLAENDQIPLRLIQYVKNSHMAVVIDDLDTDLPVIDEYLQHHHPKSLLCLPLLNQGKLTGIFYLHNQLTSRVFTPDRLQVLNSICTQAAISLKNVYLYQTLRQSENKFRELVENISDLIYSITPEGNFSYLSPQFYDLFGYEVDLFLHQSLGVLIHPEDLPHIISANQQLFNTGEKQTGLEFRMKHQAGYWVWVTCNNAPMFDPLGNIIGFYGILRDISDRKQAELQLQQTNEELIRATRLKDEFLANMSHELRTPLNAILGMTEALTEEVFGAVNERQLKSLETIEGSASHLLEVISDILDVAKIESGHLELKCAPTSVNHICQSSITFIKQQAHIKRITIETKFPPNLPDWMGDERRIRQAMINLLNNAVKFTPEGGRITLEVKNSEPGFLQVSITDTGIGISPQNIKKLFQPFIQIDSSLNRQYDGTGLGLALVKRIVELHGGSVGLTSEVGVGSCFSFKLPCVDATAQSLSLESTTLAETLESEAPAVTSPLVLLAEDNEANISTIYSYLEAKGYRIVVANNGQEAIDLVQSARPDLVLMDIQMPGMDGLEAMQEIRRNPQFADLPIIALTALAMTGDREKCIAAGANDYISKPIKLKNLAQTIQAALVD